MARSNPVYYVNPNAISITPNANNSPNDLAVYIQSGTTIKVYSKAEPGLDFVDNEFQAWTLTGRNRRLKGGDGPYTIYARLSKTNKTAYLVFAPKSQTGKDKYPYITQEGLFTDTSEQPSDTYWFVRLGEVSAIANNQRTVTLDTGILGTAQYNNQWEVENTDLPIRMNVVITLDDNTAETLVSPVPYGKMITIAAWLIQGWDIPIEADHWTVTRNTGSTEDDAAWNETWGGTGDVNDGRFSINLSFSEMRNDLGGLGKETFFTITAYDEESNVIVSRTINIPHHDAQAYTVEMDMQSFAIMVDDFGNVEGGLWVEEGDYRTYRLHTAVTARRGNKYLTLAPNGAAPGIGQYQIYPQAGDCTLMVSNGTVYVTGIDNIKDGVAGTDDDVMTDGWYERMRQMKEATAMFTVVCEGAASITKSLPISIGHLDTAIVDVQFLPSTAVVNRNPYDNSFVGLPAQAELMLSVHGGPIQPTILDAALDIDGVPIDEWTAETEHGYGYATGAGAGWDITFEEEENTGRHILSLLGIPSSHSNDNVVLGLTVQVDVAGRHYEYRKTFTIGIGVPGGNTATIFLYKRSAESLLATGISQSLWYVFSQKLLYTDSSCQTQLQDLNGWSQAIPSGNAPLYITAATAFSMSDKDEIPSTEWADPVVLARNGLSQEYYHETHYAWSEYASTANNLTAPGDVSLWSQSVPSKTASKPYLWMRDRVMTLNGTSYTAGNYTYTRITGEDGTGVGIKGSFSWADVESWYQLQGTNIPSDDDVAIQAYLSGVHSSPTTGDSYIYQENGHLWVWNSTVWQDVGQIKGADGNSQFIHIAWCNMLGTGIDWSNQDTGFTTTKNAEEYYEYMGVLVNETETPDPDVHYAGNYKWNRVRGINGINTAAITIYKRSENGTSADLAAPEDMYYCFADGKFYIQSSSSSSSSSSSDEESMVEATATQFKGWQMTIPGGSARCYARQAVALGTGEYDEIKTGEWSTPCLFVENGAPGENAEIPAFLYKWENEGTTPNKPSNVDAGNYMSVSGSASLGGGWTKHAPNRQAGKHLWMTQNTIVKVASSYAYKNNAAWGDPVRISGDNGDVGADGSDMEFIYRLFVEKKESFEVTELPENIVHGTVPNGAGGRTATDDPTLDDFVPDDWSDSPQGVNEHDRYEYMSWRSKPAGINQSWGPFYIPVLWSHYGHNGMDGDGVEYVFARTDSPTPPQIFNNKAHGGTSYLQDEFMPAVSGAKTMSGGEVATQDYATDDPQGVTPLLPYEWVAKRTKGEANADGVRTWNKYKLGDMSLWAKWSKDGDNAVRIDLDNEYDTMLYEGDGITKITQSVSTNVSLYDGTEDKSESVTFEYYSHSNVTYTIIGRVLTVTGISAGATEGYLTIKAQYKGAYYYARFTVKKLVGIDKYDLVVNPNAIGVNISNTIGSSEIGVQVYRTPANGGTRSLVQFAKQNGSYTNGYGLALSVVASANPANLTESTTGDTVTTRRFTLSSTQATSANDVTVTLEKNGVILDAETIPVTHVQNGVDGSGSNAVRIDLDNELDSIPCDSTGKVTSSTVLATNARIYNGASPVTSELGNISVGAIAGYNPQQPSTTDGVVSIRWSIPAGAELSADKYTAAIEIEWNGNSYYAVFSANVVRSGAPGVSPDIWQLVPTASEICFSKNQQTSGTKKSLCCYITITNGSDHTVYDTGSVQNGVTYGGKTYYIHWKFDTDSSYARFRTSSALLVSASPIYNPGIPGDTNATSVEFVLSSKSNSNEVSSDNIIDIETVPILKDAQDGNPGDSIRSVSIYKWAETAPQKPTSPSIPPAGWSTTDSGTHGSSDLLWMCWGTAVNGALTSDGWSGPVRMSGKDGNAGADGEIHEYIYKKSNSSSTPEGYAGTTGTIPDPANPGQRISTDNPAQDDFVPNGWTDNPQGVDSSNKYEYCSIREKVNGTWQAFSIPFPWAVYGDKGQDGDGVGYVFFLTKGTSYVPTVLTSNDSPSDVAQSEYRPRQTQTGSNYNNTGSPSRWTDDPTGVSDTWPVEWVSQRRKTGGSWGAFSPPAVWSKWSDDGTSPWFADIDNEMDSVACDTNGHPISQQTVDTNVSLYYGNTPKGFNIAEVTMGYSIETNVEVVTVPSGQSNVMQELSGNFLRYGTAFRGSFLLSKRSDGGTRTRLARSTSVTGFQDVTDTFSAGDTIEIFLWPEGIVDTTYTNYLLKKEIPVVGAGSSGQSTVSSNPAGVNIATVGGTVTVTYGTAATINGKDDFEITLRATEDNSIVRKLHFVVNGVRPGANGEPAVIYNLLPSTSQISVGRTDAGGYNPSTFSLRCGYVKDIAGTKTSVPDIANSTGSIDGQYNIYHRKRRRTDGEWTKYYLYRTYYNNSEAARGLTNIPVASYDAVEFVMCTNTQSKIESESAPTGIIDRETVPVVSDGQNGEPGQNAVRVDLDNEHEDFLYNETRTRLSSPVASQAHLYEGAEEVTSGVTWSIDTDHSDGVYFGNNGVATNDTYQGGVCWITPSGMLHVNGIISDATIMVKAVYGGNSYYAKFTARMICGDKYELVLNRNSLSWNTSETWTTQAIGITVNRTSIDGSIEQGVGNEITINDSLHVYARYMAENQATGELAEELQELYYSGGWSMSVTSQIVENNGKIVIELRKANDNDYDEEDPTTYTVEDYETIPILKAADGAPGVTYRCRWELSGIEVTTLAAASNGTLKNINSNNATLKATLMRRDGGGQEAALQGTGTVTFAIGTYSSSANITNGEMAGVLNLGSGTGTHINDSAILRVSVTFTIGSESQTYSIYKVLDGSMPIITIDNGVWCINGQSTGVRAEGTNGTGVELKGSVDVLNNSDKDGNQTSLEELSGMSIGDCYVVNSNRHLYFFNGGQTWPDNWNDLGEFKGENGVNSYMHIAWAENIGFDSSGNVNSVTGFTTDYDNAHTDGYDWIGFCTDDNPNDPGSSDRRFGSETNYIPDARQYKWNYLKGKDGDGYEYVYMRSKTENAPLINENDSYIQDGRTYSRTTDEYRPSVSGYVSNGNYANERFTDDPMGVSETWPYEYQAVRKKVNGVWKAFSPATLHRKYGQDGVSPYIASLDTEFAALHVTASHPTKNQSIIVVPSLYKGGTQLTPVIRVVKRRNSSGNDVAMAWNGSTSQWTDTGLAVSYSGGQITLAYGTNAVIPSSGKDIFTFTIAHIVAGTAVFAEEKILTVSAIGNDIYTLVPSQTQIIVKRTSGGYIPETFTLTCGYTKVDIDGQVTSVADVTEQIDATYNIYFRFHSRQNPSWGSYYLYRSHKSMLSGASVANYDSVEFVICKDTEGDVASVSGQIASVTVPVLTDGTVGATGPSYYYLGEWYDMDNEDYIAENTIVASTKYERPFVSYTVGNAVYYFLFVGETSITAPSNEGRTYDVSSRPNNPKIESGAAVETDIWEPMQSENKYIISKAIFSQFAQFGGARFSGDWMMSTNGQIGHTSFQSKDDITVETLNPSGHTTEQIPPCALFDVQKPTSDGTTLYEEEKSNNAAPILDNNTTQHTLLSSITLEAGKTYFVKTKGSTTPNNVTSYYNKGKCRLRLTNVETGSQMDVTDLVGDSINGMKMSFFRVSQHGTYTIDVYSAQYQQDIARADLIGDYILYLDSWSYGECSFAPRYAVDLLTGMTIQGYGFSSGAIRRSKIVIDDSSIDYYTRPVEGNAGYRYIDIDLCGSFVEIKQQYKPCLQLPMFCIGGKKVAHNSTSNYDYEADYTDEDRDYARSFVGTKILIYITDGGLSCHYKPDGGSISIHADEFVYEQSNATISSGYSNKVRQVQKGQFFELECCIGTDALGEIVFWRINTIGNMA